MMAKQNAFTTPKNVIDLTLDDSDEEEDDRKMSPSELESLRKRQLPELMAVSSKKSKNDDDDEVQFVEAPASLQPVIDDSNNDEIQIVGTKNHVDLPHMRQHCTKIPWGCSNNNNNQQYCSTCYCYVCDKPVKECTSWTAHCQATDTGPTSIEWKKRRDRIKKGLPEAGGAARPAATAAATAPRQGPPAVRINSVLQAFLDRGRQALEQRGPAITKDSVFGPDDPNAASNPKLLQCRHCQWYTYKYPSALFQPRCNSCGLHPANTPRIPVSHQCEPMKADCHLLGERVISFKIVPYDPRRYSKYKTRWAENPQWAFNEQEAKKEFFLEKISERPTLSKFLGLTSVLSEDKLKLIEETYGGRRIARGSKKVFINYETSGIILEGKDIALLHALSECRYFHNEMLATWDTSNSVGELRVRVGLAFLTSLPRDYGEKEMAFLYLFFGNGPFSLSDLAKTGVGMPLSPALSLEGIDNFPNLHPGRTLQDIKSEAKSLLTQNRKVYEKELAASLSHETLLSSGARKVSRALVQNRTSFEDVVGGLLLDFIVNSSRHPHGGKFVSDYLLGRKSWHRRWDLLKRYDIEADYYFSFGVANSLLPPKELVLVREVAFNGGGSKIENISDLMHEVESLGHEEAADFDGLEVELLPFQRQSLKWALERETTSGGLDAFLWLQLPKRGERDKELYFNPYLYRFSDSRPSNLVRGGFLAEEMGLGKTVISLSLILCNPAPAFPPSGSPSSSIPKLHEGPDNESTGSFWDPSPISLSGSSAKRGSILSRGTLVVCSVSLVGQWIDEAKSKLKDPGMVYAYHGTGRKRDPNILAQKSIVVTTYETLASDATYHKNKSVSNDYCPPCEEVRWWRIICDESHVLRSNSGKTKAVMDISADHRWLVSGTPISTSVEDLRNQLNFLGLSDACSYIPDRCAFISDRYHHDIFDGKAHRLAKFAAFLRVIMMRHAQGQKYRGTNTTLMSLPPKTEHDVVVDFTPTDLVEYKKLETEAMQAYLKVKAENAGQLHRKFFLLSQMLMPTRIACSGGRPPIRDGTSESVALEDDGEDDVDEHAAGQTKKRKVEVKYMDYCFTSKLKKLVEELRRVRDEDPSSKSLVFSQFNSTLEWLKVELPKHGFEFRTLSGDMSRSKRAKALREFQNDPPTTIFLLSMRAGAVGINLTQANRVFIMEPHFNPAIEAQAIGRVHRLGQTRPVEITRFIMKESVESRMVKMLRKKYGLKPGIGEAAAGGTGDAAQGDGKETNAGGTESSAVGLVGNIKTDKADIAEEEYDQLFGVYQKPSSSTECVPDAPPPSDSI